MISLAAIRARGAWIHFAPEFGRGYGDGRGYGRKIGFGCGDGFASGAGFGTGRDGYGAGCTGDGGSVQNLSGFGDGFGNGRGGGDGRNL
jgi:hypothetical protein